MELVIGLMGAWTVVEVAILVGVVILLAVAISLNGYQCYPARSLMTFLPELRKNFALQNRETCYRVGDRAIPPLQKCVHVEN